MKKLLILVSLLFTRHAFAALALDGSAETAASSGTSVTVTLSTTNTNDIIIVGTAYNGSTTASVSSVTATGLTFTKRKTTNNGNANDPTDTWEAVASSALSSVVITVNYNQSTSFASVLAFGISGANTSTIWDSNASLPATANNGAASVSTTNANDFIFGMARGGSSAPTPGAGWTQIVATSGGYVIAEYQVVSATQSGLSVTLGTAYDTMIADAVIQASGASCTHTGITSAGAIATPNGTTGSYRGKTGGFVTPDCSTIQYFQTQGAFGVN